MTSTSALRLLLAGGTIVMGACEGRSSAPHAEERRLIAVGDTIAIPPRGDSGWAAIVATGAFAARTPGYPVAITDYERDGEDHILHFKPVELGLGGSGRVRVHIDGTTSIQLSQ